MKRISTLATLLFATTLMLSTVPMVSLIHAQTPDSLFYFTNTGSFPSSSQCATGNLWAPCSVSDSGTKLMEGVTQSSTTSWTSFGIAGNTENDPYQRYLTVQCYPGTGSTVYTLLNKVVVSTSFSYSWTVSSYPQCQGLVSGNYMINVYFTLTTYVGIWQVYISSQH